MKNQINFVMTISCGDCVKLMRALTKDALKDYIRERRKVMRCKACEALTDWEKKLQKNGAVQN